MHKLAIAVILLGGTGVARAETVATLAIGTPTVTGALDAKAVSKVFNRSARKLRACLPKPDPKDLPVKATATFTIGADGKVSAATADGRSRPASTRWYRMPGKRLGADVETCIANVVARLRFPKPKGGAPVDVTYPLTYDADSLLLGALSQGGAFASLTGTADFSSGLDDANIYGSLLGDEVGEMQAGYSFGSGGFGTRGTGAGGGGTGWGTIGTGRYGVIGQGAGTGRGYGVGAGRGGMRGRPAGPTVASGQTEAKGELDPAIIRRYVRRNLQKIQFCYEKALVTQPKLEGTVTAKFTIGADGLVASSTASGLGDLAVEACVAGVIKDIQFAKPRRGAVVVSYPFTFRPAPVEAPAPNP